MNGTEDEIVLKLLHTADWHLGRKFRSFDEGSALLLSRSRLEVLERVFDEAERHQVDVVLCAGDLFDDPQPGREWVDGFVSIVKKRRHACPVFLLPGNHDPVQADSVWLDPAFRQALPASVTVIEKAGEHALPNGAVLYAVPCESRAGQSDPTVKIPRRAAKDERIRVGLVHGSTFDLPGAQLNFPISRDAVIDRGLDYLAIGDTHGFRFVPPDRKQPPTIYPGAPEPTAFDERDAGQVAIVFVNRARKALVQSRKVAAWTWEEVTIGSMAELRSLVARSDLRSRVLRVRVDLVVSAPELDEAERLLESLSGTTARHGLVGVLDLQRERLELDLHHLEEWTQTLPSVLKAAVAKLEAAAQDQEQRAAAQRALFHLYRSTRKAS